ncbi:hypothetical protein COLO4_24120 [Corchorus olitorius]|uniref:Endonuclease/exonuclease/phosphatase domain-containing protein n=1 Tax=Corchorus olitorius TaxID=93759 RepID=A0A1R3ICM6_9ROSI|nr:hypothetical protein COLO4_24120 [Corchorus olitorius]
MDGLLPVEDLADITRQLIVISQIEMSLQYPEIRPDHQATMRNYLVLMEAIKLITTTYLPFLNDDSKNSLLTWFAFNLLNLPSPEKAIEKLHHDHIQEEIYTRGLANFSLPMINGKERIIDPERFDFQSSTPSVAIDGNHQRIVLLTTLPNFGVKLKIRFSINVLTRSTTHFLDLSHISPENLHASPTCATWGKCPCPSMSAPNHSTRIKILLYNVKGAATTTFPADLARHYHATSPHLLIITETRQPGKTVQKIMNSLDLDWSQTLEPAGFYGGIWMLWKKQVAELYLERKEDFKLAAEIKVIFND